MVFALCTSSDSCLSMYQVSYNSLQYFQRYAPDKLSIAKIIKGSNYINTGDKVTVLAFPDIICDRVMVLALCTSSGGRLSMYQVLFNSLLYFQRYAPGKLFTAKIKKGGNSINTDNIVMILAFCNFPHGPLSVYQVSLNYLQYF